MYFISLLPSSIAAALTEMELGELLMPTFFNLHSVIKTVTKMEQMTESYLSQTNMDTIRLYLMMALNTELSLTLFQIVLPLKQTPYVSGSCQYRRMDFGRSEY